MSELLKLLGGFAILFAVSVGLSYLFMIVVARRRKQHLRLAPDVAVRLRALSGVYRSRFLREENQTWVFSAPIQRDRYVPIRPEERLTIESPSTDGVLLFRSEVLARRMSPFELVLKKPDSVHHLERRKETRDSSYAGAPIMINGKSASLVNLSGYGAMALSTSSFKKGDEATIILPGELGRVSGWIVESCCESVEGCMGARLRVQFDERAPGFEPELKKRRRR